MANNKKQQNSTLSPITGLTPQQEQAATMLASGTTITEVARQVGINRSTLYDWQDNTAFQCFYNQQCKDQQEAIKNALFGLHNTAIETITDLLTSGNENTRLKASMWLLERVASISVGETKIRAALQRQCTHSNFEWNDERFDDRKYKQSLKDFGLCD